MNVAPQTWFALSLPSEGTLRCAACKGEIDQQFPTADHHPRVCPACGVKCAFLTGTGRTIQIVVGNAPWALAEAIGWAQEHLDELEYVELICALEESADTAGAGTIAVPNRVR